MYHFEDDTNLLNFKSCVKSIKKQVNYDLNNLGDWVKANVNIGKTELVLFTSPEEQLECDLKIKVNGKKLYETVDLKQIHLNIWEFKLTKD